MFVFLCLFFYEVPVSSETVPLQLIPVSISSVTFTLTKGTLKEHSAGF